MKKHAIIPIFIPHEGCPNDCVFCNQNKITAHQKPVDCNDVKNIIDTHLATITKRHIETIEIAFYGGSFTGLDIDKQSEYLSIAKTYKDSGLVDKIHLSTRPDYINEKILDNLKRYDVNIIELGVQSFDDEVLTASNRGHTSSVVYNASSLIKDYGFTLGIQLMIGLPKDSLEKCIYSAKETVKIAPSIARLYPTIVIKDTELYSLCATGQYTPLSQEEAILRTKKMYEILTNAGINIIRVGLKSSDIISENGDITGNTFHPAFRQLVESEIARDIIDKKINEIMTDIEHTSGAKIKLTIYANNHSLPNAVGNRAGNKKYWYGKYRNLKINFKVDNTLKDMDFEIKAMEESYEI